MLLLLLNAYRFLFEAQLDLLRISYALKLDGLHSLYWLIVSFTESISFVLGHCFVVVVIKRWVHGVNGVQRVYHVLVLLHLKYVLSNVEFLVWRRHLSLFRTTVDFLFELVIQACGYRHLGWLELRTNLTGCRLTWAVQWAAIRVNLWYHRGQLKHRLALVHVNLSHVILAVLLYICTFIICAYLL